MRLCLIIAAALALAPHVAGAQPAQIKFAFPSPAASFLNTMAVTPWIESVERDAKGALEVKLYTGPTLANTSNVYDRILNGVADAGRGVFFNLVEAYPRTTVTMLPFEGDDTVRGSVALWRLYAGGVFAGDDYEKVKPLALFLYPTSNINTNKPVRDANDLKGLKVAVSSRLLSQIVEQLGATPVTMTPPDFYPSMQRGVVGGLAMGWSGMHSFKMGEVTRYHLDLPSGQASAFVFMNRESYARLPDDAKRAVDRNSGEGFSKALGAATDAETEEGRRSILAMPGHVASVLAPDEALRWKARLQPTIDDWIKTTSDGAKVLSAWRAEIAKVRAGM